MIRDTTAYKHAIIQRKLINHDSGDGRKLMCCWDTCELDSYELYKVRVNTANDGYEVRYMNYTFCSERHKQYWLNNCRPNNNNNLPPGYRGHL